MLRRLKPEEVEIARRVFGDAIPYDRVCVTPLLGLGRRPFTTTLPPFTPFALGYALSVGREGYRGMESTGRLRGLLVHELTHVWQGCRHFPSCWFMLNSILNQGLAAISRRLGRGPASAYAYEPGRPWEEYNAEQQASIVQDWFLAGEREDDERFVYVRDRLRAGG